MHVNVLLIYLFPVYALHCMVSEVSILMEAALTVRMSVRPPAKFTEKTDWSPVSRGMLKRRRYLTRSG